jgi:hypothetical protein
MILICHDDCFSYRIETPDDAEVRRNHGGTGTDFLVVNEDDQEFYLWDQVLIEAARTEDLGLRLISAVPLN